MLYEIILIYFLTGALAGFVSGLFGVGGAFTMAPALIIGLPLQGVPDEHVMHLSAGTALGVMAATSAYVAALRYRTGDLQLPVTLRFVPFIVIGAVAGSIFGDYLPGDVLKIIFMGFIGVAILRGIFYKGHETVAAGGDLHNVRGPGLWFHGTLTGITGSLLGPGPAMVIGPYLRVTAIPCPWWPRAVRRWPRWSASPRRAATSMAALTRRACRTLPSGICTARPSRASPLARSLAHRAA